MSDVGVRRQGARFEFVDALRGLAALAVVLPHALGLLSFQRDSSLTSLFLRLAEYGRAGVEVFFVISGFAIAYSMRASGVDEDFSLGRFMLRRAVRLDPPYWVGLLWMGLVEAFRAHATHQPIALPSLGKVLAHLAYLQDILGFGQFNAVFWTLCLEFQLYFVFAVLMRAASAFGDPREGKSRVWRDSDKYGWLMVLAFLASLLVSHTIWPMNVGWFVPFFYLFLSGSLAAWRVLDRISDRLFRICLVAMGLGLVARPELPRVIGFITALLLYVAIQRAALHRWLATRAAQWLGRISYSVYLIHVPLATLFLGLRTRVASDSKLLSLLCLAGLYLATLALGSLFHAAIEVPCLRLSQQLKRPHSFPGSSVYRAPPR